MHRYPLSGLRMWFTKSMYMKNLLVLRETLYSDFFRVRFLNYNCVRRQMMPNHARNMSCESGSRILKRSIGTLQIEPPYLAKLEPEIPSFKLTNIQLRGYDLVVLERFGKYAKNVVEKMDLEVESFWATPKQSLSVKLMKPNSNIVKQTYDLSLYERNIQLVNLPSTKVPVLINVIESLLPPGVKLTIHEHQPEHLEIRYLPDLMLEELEEELQNIGKDR